MSEYKNAELEDLRYLIDKIEGSPTVEAAWRAAKHLSMLTQALIITLEATMYHGTVREG